MTEHKNPLIAILHPNNPWAAAYPLVGQHVARFLDSLPADKRLRTGRLAEYMIPEAIAKGHEAKMARKRLFQALRALAQHDLDGYATTGTVQMPTGFKGAMGYPTWWHKGPPVEKWVNQYAEQDAKQAIDDDIAEQMKDL